MVNVNRDPATPMLDRAKLVYKIASWAFDGSMQKLNPFSHGEGFNELSVDVKVISSIPTKDTREEIIITKKEPKNESANMAPRIGSKVMQPLTMFAIWAASMLLTLNSLIRYTIRLFDHPPAASVNPPMVAT